MEVSGVGGVLHSADADGEAGGAELPALTSSRTGAAASLKRCPCSDFSSLPCEHGQTGDEDTS